MTKYLIHAILSFFAFPLFLQGQISISDARSSNIGDEVIVTGIVTNGSELGIIRYLQDGTAGIAAYPGTGSVGNFPDDVKRGDSIRVRGPLKVFNELLEIDPILEYEIISSNNPIPDTKVIATTDISEALEGQLLEIKSATFIDGGSVFGVGNYTFETTAGNGEIYVRSNHPLVGEDIPLASVNIIGILSQFNSQYQILPRDNMDIEISDNFFIDSAPRQSDISTNGFAIEWTTNIPGSSVVRYGLTQNLGSEKEDNSLSSQHRVILTDLEPAEFYYVQVVSDNGNSTVESPISYYATASESSGEIHVYFNNQVDGSISQGFYPTGTSPIEVENAIINHIDNAENTIDVSMYNVNRAPLIAALTRAHDRGVRVRYIADNETANLALANPTPPFSIIRGNSDGLMHNKFLAIDAVLTDKSWLITGSMNFTQENIGEDFNNMITIQDQSLVKAYVVEFEEMWGSTGSAPGIFNVKFGEDKTDNTPHSFNVNGIAIESYFSPSDNTTANIAQRIDEAQNDISFALLTFTNNTLGSAVLNAHNRGVSVRGIIDNINDTGSEYSFLSDRGVDVSQDFTSTVTHHKYCIIDSESGNSNPVLITGSHNWSAGAETRNDENTLIIHDQSVANIFQQEFEARWCEVQSGSSPCTTSIDFESENIHSLNIFPNPANDQINLEIETKIDSERLSISILSMEGKVIKSSIVANHGYEKLTYDVSTLMPGTYLINLKVGNESWINRFVKL